MLCELPKSGFLCVLMCNNRSAVRLGPTSPNIHYACGFVDHVIMLSTSHLTAVLPNAAKTKRSVKKGAYLATLQFGHKSPMPELLYTLLPRGLYERWSSTFPIPDDMTEKNTDKCGFYIPEFNQISRKFVKLRAPFAPKEPLETFVVGQKRLANDIMRVSEDHHAEPLMRADPLHSTLPRLFNGSTLLRRSRDRTKTRLLLSGARSKLSFIVRHQHSLLKETSIEKRLLSEGWTRSEFHSGWDRHDNETIDQWNQIMDQPRALTERSMSLHLKLPRSAGLNTWHSLESHSPQIRRAT